MELNPLNWLKKRDAAPVVQPVNNGPSATVPEASANVAPFSMDPLQTARVPMTETTPSVTPEPSVNMVSVETPTATPSIDSAPSAPESTPTITTVDSAPALPIGTASTEQPTQIATGTPNQQRAA